MQRKILNAVSVFFSVIICIALVLLLVVTPFYYSVTALTKPETIVKIIQDVDYERLIEEDKVIKKTVKSMGLTAKTADELIKSEQAGKLIEVYADDAVELLMQIPKEKEWNAGLIKEIVNDNMDRIIEVADQNIDQSFSKNLLRAKINTAIESNEKLIEKAAPVLNQVKVVVETVKASRVIERTMTVKFAIALGAAFAVAATAVCLLRRREFKGFLWLSISFITAVLLLAAVVIYSKSGFVNTLAVSMSDFGTEILTSAISVYADKLIAALLCTLALALVSAVAFAAGYQKVTAKPEEKPSESLK